MIPFGVGEEVGDELGELDGRGVGCFVTTFGVGEDVGDELGGLDSGGIGDMADKIWKEIED